MKVHEIWKVCIEAGMRTIIARAHNSQSIVLYLWRVFTFGMSIAGIRHVDSCGIARPLGVSFFGMSIAGIRHVDIWIVVPLTIVYATETSEHWFRNLLEGWREYQVGASCCQEAISWTKSLKHKYHVLIVRLLVCESCGSFACKCCINSMSGYGEWSVTPPILLIM